MRATAVLAAIFAIASASASDSAARTDRAEILYAISAHPDDEFGAWSVIQNRPSTYIVFVLMTQGERTTSCLRPSKTPPPSAEPTDGATLIEGLYGGDAGGIVGAYKYQGPRSPVGEPDLGERHPLGFPWKGKGTNACANARVASWHWFLDDMSALDTGLPNLRVRRPRRDDNYRGRFCTKGAGCAEVWTASGGARIAFDLGDGSLRGSEIDAAIQTMLRRRASWGLPTLPPAGIVTGIPYVYEGPGCPFTDPHPDHIAVHDALFGTDHGFGPQLGTACPLEPRYGRHPGPILGGVTPLTLLGANDIDPATEERLGAWVVNYGWLFDSYVFAGNPAPQSFWSRFGP